MARDHEGSILLAGFTLKPGCIDVRQVEAMAVSVGLRVVLQRNFQQVYWLECDALSVVSLLHFTEIRSILSDIYKLVQGHRVVFEHVHRSANVVAHNLACFALSLTDLETGTPCSRMVMGFGC